MPTFAKSFTFDERAAEASSVRKKYPDRVPVVVELGAAEKTLPPLTKNKYLVPLEMKMGEFMYTIRQKMKLSSKAALFMLTGGQTAHRGSLPCPTDLLVTTYNKFKSNDGFLYFELHAESVFGGF